MTAIEKKEKRSQEVEGICLIAIKKKEERFDDNDGICMYGTTAYHAVWEKYVLRYLITNYILL